jgi:hypothetical protein
VLPNSEHRRHKRLNNRAENSHLPTRKRERILQRFKSVEHAQRFLVHSALSATTSVHADTDLPPPPTDRPAPTGTPFGRTSPWAESAADDGLSEDIRAHCVSRRCRAVQLDSENVLRQCPVPI